MNQKDNLFFKIRNYKFSIQSVANNKRKNE